MKYNFDLESRSSLDISAEQKHLKVVEFLKTINEEWGVNPAIDIPFPGFGEEAYATLSLRKVFKKSISCLIQYRYRNMLSDHHSCDDRIAYEFNVTKIDYERLVEQVFPRFIQAFSAYRGSIYPEELIYLDFEKSRFKNSREVIYRIYPVMYLDRILCKRVFLLTPEEVFEKLKTQIYKVEIINDGILLIASSKPLSVTECNEFDLRIQALLNLKL